MKRFITYILAFLLLAAPLYADQKNSVSDLKKQREKTLKELEKTSKMLNETKKNETATLNKLQLLNKNIEERKRLIGTINAEIGALDDEMTQLTMQRDQLQEELEALKADYAKMVKLTHHQDMQRSPLLFVLSAEDFNQSIRRIRYLQQFQQYRKLQVQLIEEKQQDIDTQNLALQENRTEREGALVAQQQEKERLARDEKKQQAMLTQLKKKEKQLREQQKKQQKKADDLNRKIEEMIRKQAEEQKKKNGGKLTQEQTLIAGGFEKNKGRLPWPVEKGVVTGEYGVHPHPTIPNITVNNKGIYISTSKGAAVRAVFEGEVTGVFVTGGTTAVIIQHGNYRTVYGGLASVSIKKGDKVTTKQKIGVVYTDADNDNKTELFFQVWKNTDILNPRVWITK